jgi:nucleoside-diphosphate-sugar epimerase
MKKVLVTGATGLLGSWISKELAESGHQVSALKRSESKKPYFLDKLEKLQWVEGDLLDPLQMEKILEEIDWIIHCGALVSTKQSERELMYQTNVTGTQIIVDLALQQEKEYFLHVSSVAAVGRPKDQKLIDEETTWEESKYITHYARSKYLAEKEVWRGFSEGLKGSIINPSVILGPGNWDHSSGRFFGYVQKEGRFLTSGALNIVDVRDVSRASLRLLDEQIIGERFILNSDNLTYTEFFQQIAKSFQKRAPWMKLGKAFLRFLKIPENILAFVLRKDPFLTRDMVNNFFSSHKFSSEKFQNRFNFSFIRTEESIKWACEEMVKYNVEKNPSS